MSKLITTLAAAAMLGGGRFMAMDTGSEPARIAEPRLTAGDLERIAAAKAKRDRKAAKRLVIGNTHGGK